MAPTTRTERSFRWSGTEAPNLQHLTSPRHFANTKAGIGDPKPAVLPGSASTTTLKPAPPAPALDKSATPSMTSPSPATPTSASTIPPENVPLTPPPPPGSKTQTAPPSSLPRTPSKPTPPASPAAFPPPPPPKRKPRRFRRFLLTLILLTGIGFGGGVYYSLVSDNFHDFFTEYIPFGEDAVLYFEEREFRRRFPRAPPRATGSLRDTGNKVTIPSRSGISWNIADDKQTNVKDAQSKGSAKRQDTEDVKQHPLNAIAGEKDKAVDKVKQIVGADGAKQDKQATSEKKAAPSSSKKPEAKSEGSIKPDAAKPAMSAPPPKPAAPIARIDPLKIDNADNPVVQDLVKIVNDIITVVNADGASQKYSSAISSAKSSLAKVGMEVLAMKETEKNAAEEKIRSSHEEFDAAARELVKRLEDEMRNQEAQWKDDFESEREKISQSYQEKLKTELEREKEISQQRLRNQLLEQAIEMKGQFKTNVKDRVEEEREGRLSKLTELASSVDDLEKLTTNWNEVIDANLKTQHLQVAVEAVRSNLAEASKPRPFVRELAALKEIASDDAVVNAAIASLNPITYQRGISSSGRLIDRFRQVASEVRKASLLPEDAGVASHAASLVLSKFMFKKKGLASGDDVESILTRTETLLEEGNLDAAAREMNELTGWAKTLSQDWLGEVRRALEVQQALEVIATEARLQSLRVEALPA
ncbi:MAG: Formation of crista junctions protein 1 [Caeruleum heppii]|nr:MAG: Formation of crista junctions protein 1 [Caeruleum heppii]